MIAIPRVVIPVRATPVPTPSIAAVLMEVGSADNRHCIINRHKRYKVKNYEMKGDVGMSVHEKERKQEDAYTKTQTHS